MHNLLTKSRYVNGLQCPKYLWTIFHAPDKIPAVDASTQHRFDQGHLVGEYAKKLFPEGIEVSSEDFMQNIKLTTELLSKRKPLFEAGFLKNRLYSRIDILVPAEDDLWDIVEVKSGTKVKEVNYHDVSFQKHCCEIAGLKIRKCFLMHINNEYVRHGEIDPSGLFKKDDITSDVRDFAIGIEERIVDMFKIIDSNELPKVNISTRCDDPYECPLDCWDFLPEQNVFELYRGGKLSFTLYEEGVLKIKDIPDDYKLSDKQDIQKECALNGKPHIEKSEIKSFLSTMRYPLQYLDFETFNSAIPMFEGMRPYQRVPFQFSLHIVENDGKTTHHSFLAEGQDDPRPEFVKALKKFIGKDGSVVVYNKSFEIGVMTELSEEFPGDAVWLNSVCKRAVDLLLPFRDFSYYHPDQAGSASIKHVLPAMTGKGYSELEINNGDAASLSYLDMTYGRLSEEEKRKVRKNLEIYCGLDTEGMIWIVDELKKIVE